MARDRKPQQKRTPQEDLECHYASRQIEQTDYVYPEFRLELVDSKFLVGGLLDGSRWLLKEALIGWGLESAVAFAPLNQWWEALRLAHELPFRSPDEWLTWAEDLPIGADYREPWWPPLGSQYLGEHHWVRNRLRNSLSAAVSQGALGSCFGPNYGMQVGQHMFTPDVLMVGDVRLSENILHDCYIEDVADLVVEILLPEKADIDEHLRRQYYEREAVSHYWVVNPVTQQTQFWEWSTEGYQIRLPDPDGCYRGIPGLTFSPQLLWSTDDEKLPVFSSTYQPRRWQLADEAGEEISWGSVPFEPVVALAPSGITVQQFVSWCPETKLEGGPFPLIGGQTGTRNAIAMLLMSLGLVETVRLMPGYEWVRVLRRIERQQQQDAQKRQAWRFQAEAMAQQLHSECGVGGVGVIGDLIQSRPLHVWSEIHLVVWDVPERFGRRVQSPPTIPLRVMEVKGATPAEWQEIRQHMVVLVGQWHEQEQPQPQKRLQFQWLNS